MMPAPPAPNQPLAPAAGSRAPDLTLPDSAGRSWTLGELTRDGAAVLIFYRGVW
ncbi:MAG: hypothetical protein ACRD17_08315 [Terriglobales bacterium]